MLIDSMKQPQAVGPENTMVQKWAIGAMINMSGSIAINLGTNLMKLSHKVTMTTTRNASFVGV